MIPPHKQYVEDFVKFLKSTLSTDNEDRKKAEKKLNDIDLQSRINLSLCVLSDQYDDESRSIAAVLMRNDIIKLDSVQQLSAETLSSLKTILPQKTLYQHEAGLRNKYVSLLSALFSLCYGTKSNWTQLNSFLYDCIEATNNPVAQHISFQLIQSSPSILREFNSEQLSLMVSRLATVMTQDITTHKFLVISALKAASTLFLSVKIKVVRELINEPMQAIFHVIKNCNNDEVICQFLEELNVIIEERSKVMNAYVVPLLETMMGLLVTEHTCTDIRKEAMECIVSFAEHSKHSFLAKGKEALPQLVDVLIRHITIINDDQSWYFSVKEDDDDEDICTIAETSLDRITCALGGKIMFPIIMEKLSPLLSSKIWQHRYAALVSLSCTAEGCVKQMKPLLPKIVDAIDPYMKDEHPRVVYACINVIGQFAMDFMGHFHKHFHQKVFASIFYAVGAYAPYPRVQAHAVLCFINLIDGCPANIVEHYSDDIFNRLHTLFGSSIEKLGNPGVPIVLQNVLSSLSTFAETLGPKFVKYYRSIISHLIKLVDSFSRTPHTKYYISSLDTLSTVLLAVGQKECTNELNCVLDVLKRFQITSINDDGPAAANDRLEYLEIMSKISKVFGEAFSEVVPTLIPVLLKILSTPLDGSFIRSCIATSEPFTSDKEGYSKAYAAHTDQMADRVRVCSILKTLCDSVKGKVADHVDQICDALIKSVSDFTDEDVQEAVCELYPILLKCLEPRGIDVVIGLWYKIFDSFHKQLSDNQTLYVSDKIFNGICACINVTAQSGLNQNLLVSIMELMDKELNRVLAEWVSKLSAGALKDNGEEDLEDENEFFEDDLEEAITSSIQDLDRTLFKLLGVNFLPYFGHIFKQVVRMLDSQYPSIKTWGLCFITDLIEFAAEQSTKLSDQFLGYIHNGVRDSDPSLRQCSAYAVAVMTEHGHQFYQTFISNMLPLLVGAINDKDSLKDENLTATANCIAAVARIMKHSPNLVQNFDEAVVAWINWLPVIDDEVDFNLDYLLELVESKFQRIAAAGQDQVMKVLTSIATMIPYVNDEAVTKRSVLLLSQMKNVMPDLFNYWYDNIDECLRDNLKLALSSSG